MGSNYILLGFVIVAAVLASVGAVYLSRALRARRDEAAREVETLRSEIAALRATAEGRDRAEAASLTKSRFLASVSHEIRTPLNGILGLAQLLAMTRLNAEQASYVEAIRDCSRSLAQLIDDILDFSKIEAGKTEVRRDVFPLTPVIEGVVELLAPRAQGKNLEIASFIAPDVPRKIVGDAARVRQILINLVGNAVNFTQSGGVGLRVFCGDDGELLFEVSDTGPGVPPEARRNIFEEFEQVDGSTSRQNKGVGLGLAISRRLARRMGGRLELTEGSEKGAKFVFALPLATLGRTIDEDEAPQSKRLDGGRVLIVAHSVFEAPLMASTLESAGADAEIASGVDQGLARLAVHAHIVQRGHHRLPVGRGSDGATRRRSAGRGRQSCALAILSFGEAHVWRGGVAPLRWLVGEAGSRQFAHRTCFVREIAARAVEFRASGADVARAFHFDCRRQ